MSRTRQLFLTTLALTAISLFTALPPAQAQGTRGTTAFVDFQQVFTNYFKTRLANEQLQEMSDSINREQVKMMLQLDALQREYKDLRDSAVREGVSETERAEIRKRVDSKLIDVRRQEERLKFFNESQQKRWQEQNQRIRRELMDELQAKIRAIGKAKGYLAIIDIARKDEAGVPAALYHDENQDITLDVIRKVNE